MWKYMDTLNQEVALLIITAAGFVAVWARILQRADIRVLNTLVVKFALPALVINGLGTKVNLYDHTIWTFVSAFFLLRGMTLILAAIWTIFFQRGSIGDCMVHWMVTTWISSVILGIPIVTAALGAKYTYLGLLAGISSFLFQLPVMMFCFEIHRWRQSNPALAAAPSVSANPDSVPSKSMEVGENIEEGGVAMNVSDGSSNGLMKSHRGLMSKSQLKSLALGLAKNHILWGIAIGFVLSLSKIGTRWLDPGALPVKPNCSYVAETGWFTTSLSLIGACTTPVALFVTGMWMHQKNPFGDDSIKLAVYMVLKLIAVPALMIACCKIVGLEGSLARGAVLIASLPVSEAAFAFSKEYSIGERVSTLNVVVGILLLLPTTICWLSFMDAVDLFPASPIPVLPNACSIKAPAPAALKGL